MLTSDDTVRNAMKQKPSSQLESVTKRSRNDANDGIDADRCCICFGCFAVGLCGIGILSLDIRTL